MSRTALHVVGGDFTPRTDFIMDITGLKCQFGNANEGLPPEEPKRVCFASAELNVS